jgi:hypothetical protein
MFSSSELDKMFANMFAVRESEIYRFIIFL